MRPSIRLADRSRNIRASAIREVLKTASRPGVISLAGGIPAPESFPLELFRELTDRVLTRYGASALQYDPTEGFAPLREALAGHLEKKGVLASADEILVSSGSQGVLDAVGKIMISPGDRVALESPTYLGALQAFAPYEPSYATIASDEDGAIPESLEETLKTGDVKFVYLVPTFQNPTGRTIPMERREKIAELLVRHGALLLEDDPYSALRYRGEDLAPIKTLAPDHVIYTGTFSKVFAPGLRTGFCAAPGEVRRWMVKVKQGVDLHTSTYSQALAAEYLTGGYLEKHLPKILSIYAPRLDAMLEALKRYFPESFSWSRPEGGMFVWAKGPANFDSGSLYPKAVEKNTAYVPGGCFFVGENEGKNTMRLNFTMVDESLLDRAVRVLGETIRE